MCRDAPRLVSVPRQFIATPVHHPALEITVATPSVRIECFRLSHQGHVDTSSSAQRIDRAERPCAEYVTSKNHVKIRPSEARRWRCEARTSCKTADTEFLLLWELYLALCCCANRWRLRGCPRISAEPQPQEYQRDLDLQRKIRGQPSYVRRLHCVRSSRRGHEAGRFLRETPKVTQRSCNTVT